MGQSKSKASQNYIVTYCLKKEGEEKKRKKYLYSCQGGYRAIYLDFTYLCLSWGGGVRRWFFIGNVCG